MLRDARRYRELIEERGLSTMHRQALAWVPEGSRVLELGCAAGSLGEILIATKGCGVTGVEVEPVAADEARARGLHVLVGSLDNPAFREAIEGRFDVVMATDVLEHLERPADTLEHMKRWVTPAGRAIVAVPNIATWSMRAQLLRGDFDYQETGILDRTHLRFFTWDTFHELVARLGWRVVDRVVDAWEVPGLQNLLWEWPLAWRERIGPNRSGAGLLLFRSLGRLLRTHQAVGRTMGRAWPNLCAKHIGLLLRSADP